MINQVFFNVAEKLCGKALCQKAAWALRCASVATLTPTGLEKLHSVHPDGVAIPMVNAASQFCSDGEVTHSVVRKHSLFSPSVRIRSEAAQLERNFAVYYS